MFYRILILDPAGPEFYASSNADRLDASDALFVDVLHTDGAPRAVSGFGHLDELGHVDFYPNGGSAQPSNFEIIKITNYNSNISSSLSSKYRQYVTRINVDVIQYIEYGK